MPVALIVGIMLLMQAAASLPPSDTPPLFDLHWVLHRVLQPAPCATVAGDEIVVCGRTVDPEHFRLRPLDRITEPPLIPKAETTILGGATLGVAGETTMIGGAPSNRVMLKLKTKF